MNGATATADRKEERVETRLSMADCKRLAHTLFDHSYHVTTGARLGPFATLSANNRSGG